MARQWFYAFVEECTKDPLGLDLVRKAVQALSPESATLAKLIHLIEAWETVDTAATAVIPWRDAIASAHQEPMAVELVDVWDVLYKELEPVDSTEVCVAFQVATDDREVAPPWHCSSAWHVFVHLVDRASGPTQPQPYMIFLDRLMYSGLLNPRVEGLVDAWSRRVAAQQGLAAELDTVRRRRARIPDGRSPVHLVMTFDVAGAVSVAGSSTNPGPGTNSRDATGRDRFHLSWSLERYRPRRVAGAGGRMERLARVELEQAVSAVVQETEKALAGDADKLALEFVLPFDLLDTEVEWWHKEERVGPAKPLALDYAVTLRSLDRMNSPEWHRVLRERWRHVDLPAAAVTYWCTSYEPDDALSLEALLRSDERLVTLVLSGPPAVGSRGLEELIAGLRSGIAGIIWCRTDDGRTANEESLRSYVVDGRAADLPSGARRLRLAAQRLPGRAQSAHLGRQLALLWDDPDRFADVPGENGT